MKYIITKSQYNLLKEQEEPKVLKLPGIEYFGSWNFLQKFLEKRGNPPYTIEGGLYLNNYPIKSLGNLISVGSYLSLRETNVESLGNLSSVGGSIFLKRTPISKKISEKEIRNMINVSGTIEI